MTCKRWVPILSLLVLLLVACAPAEAAFKNGNSLVEEMRAYERAIAGDETADLIKASLYMGFVMGVHDIANGTLFRTPANATAGQIYAVVAKYLKNNPEHWSKGAGLLVVAALTEAFPLKE